MQEMDGVVGELLFGDDEDVPPTTRDAQPVTMAAIANLLDAKLSPVIDRVENLKNDVAVVKQDVQAVKNEVATNKITAATQMDRLEGQLREMKLVYAAEVHRLEGLLSTSHSGSSTPRSHTDCLTAVFGGCKGASSKDEADSWLSMVLKSAGAQRPGDTYIKGAMSNYNGLVFGKYTTTTDRDAAVKKVQEKGLVYGGQSAWAKVDQPPEVRTVEGVLFAAKNMLLEWGWDKTSLWVDKEEQRLKCGDDLVSAVCVADGQIHPTYGEGWNDYIFSKEHPDNTLWKDTLKAAAEKLSRKATSTKGKGKGKSTK